MRANPRYVLAIVIVSLLLPFRSAAAHAGHLHGEAIDMATLLNVAGIAAALGIAWRLAILLSASTDVPADQQDQTIA